MRRLESTPDTSTAVDDLAICRRLLAEGSQSFALAARLLPRDARDDATALYAFCRVADDAIDESTAPTSALVDLNRRLRAIEAGAPADHAVDRAVARVLVRHDIPVGVLQALLEGLSWDVSGRTYEHISDVIDYGVRVAATVGVMMTCLMGVRDSDTLMRAGELGIAMQLTNIARDIAEDAAIGRCYVPAQWRNQAFAHNDMPTASEWGSSAGRRIVANLLAEADRHYGYAWSGIEALPLRCRGGIRAAACIYREIGTVIAANGYDAGRGRAVVARGMKWRLASRAVCGGGMRLAARESEAPAARQLAPLVAATARSRPSRGVLDPKQLRWWQLGAQWAWVFELFAELSVRERLDSPRQRTSNEISGSVTSTSR